MPVLQRLAILGVVLVCGAIVFAVVDRDPPPIVQPDSPTDSLQTPIKPSYPGVEYTQKEIDELFDDSPQELFVLDVLHANIRESELSRRAQRPADQHRKKYGGPDGIPLGVGYDVVLKGRKKSPQPAEPMPPTSCRSVEPAPKHPKDTSGPHWVHHLAVSDFQSESGFGFVRMLYSRNRRGLSVASSAIDRVELVSLLTEEEPSVYVLDEMATPPLARQAKRRPLDEFERLGLDAVRRGETLVWTTDAPKRMFGAIRAKGLCLECHVDAKRGDLLGAFTYYLDTPVNELAKP
ncbi:MAG: hypothetical protein C0467_22520 [Planctomycetaceae bacterium]|nr:hypothetical protein [Planctomycetaceae bacterium]